MASPKKSKGKRKVRDLDNGPPAGRVKKTRTPKSIEATDGHPAPSGELSGPRRSGRSNAGTGGRNAQLEKLDSVFDASARKRLSKGSTSLGADIPRNPQAPDASKSCRSRKVKYHMGGYLRLNPVLRSPLPLHMPQLMQIPWMYPR